MWRVYLFPRYCSFKHSTVCTPLGTFFGGKSQKWLAGRMILEIELPRSFLKFLLKAYYYPAYYTEVDWPDWTVLSNSWILHIKTLMLFLFLWVAVQGQGKCVLRSPWIEWVQFGVVRIYSVRNCRIIGKILGKKWHKFWPRSER